jgi:hypothetical protein
MTKNANVGRLVLSLSTAAGFALLLCACVANDQMATSALQVGGANAPQPRHATYNCGDAGKISVEAGRGAVRLVNADGDVFDLPAAPPNQNTRFGEAGLALVVEGGEALWMQAGKQPLTCTR